MKNLSLGETAARYCSQLETALKHSHPEVKLMSLTELERYTADERGVADLCRRPTLLYTIIRCIGDESLAVANKASKIIEKVGVTPLGIRQLIKPDTMEVFHKIMGISDVVKLRVFEVRICKFLIVIDL